MPRHSVNIYEVRGHRVRWFKGQKEDRKAERYVDRRNQAINAFHLCSKRLTKMQQITDKYYTL